MDSKTYRDPIIAKYIDLIKASTGERFKRFYQGEPTRVGTSILPCIIIAKRETRIGPLTNAEDEHGVALQLTVVVDVRKDLSTEENDAEILEGISTLYDYVEGRDPDTFELKSDSILDILRGNLVVDAAHNLRTELGTVSRVDYGLTLGDRPPEEWRIEARIDFVAHFTQVR